MLTRGAAERTFRSRSTGRHDIQNSSTQNSKLRGTETKLRLASVPSPRVTRLYPLEIRQAPQKLSVHQHPLQLGIGAV